MPWSFPARRGGRQRGGSHRRGLLQRALRRSIVLADRAFLRSSGSRRPRPRVCRAPGPARRSHSRAGRRGIHRAPARLPRTRQERGKARARRPVRGVSLGPGDLSRPGEGAGGRRAHVPARAQPRRADRGALPARSARGGPRGGLLLAVLQAKALRFSAQDPGREAGGPRAAQPAHEQRAQAGAAYPRRRDPEGHPRRSALPADRHPPLVQREQRRAGDGDAPGDRVRHAVPAPLRRGRPHRRSGRGPRFLRARHFQGQAAQAVRRSLARALPRAGARGRLPRRGGLAGRAGTRGVGAGGGREMSERNRLLELLTELAYEKRKVVLSSGKESDFYIDTKQASLTAEGHYLVGRLVLAEIRGHFAGAQAVGGMTLGADPIASAVSLTSWLQASPLPAFYVRKEPKGHGTNQWIEGRQGLPSPAQVVVVEDVLTPGASTLKAIERCRSEGLHVLGVVALVDREEGGHEAVEKAGVELRSLFRRSDFP